MKHITKDGTVIDIESMDDAHLLNTIRLLRRKSKTGVLVRSGGGTCADDIWYDEDMVYGEEALGRLHFDAYVRVASARGLSV